jgi:hypothetical protein
MKAIALQILFQRIFVRAATWKKVVFYSEFLVSRGDTVVLKPFYVIPVTVGALQAHSTLSVDSGLP